MTILLVLTSFFHTHFISGFVQKKADFSPFTLKRQGVQLDVSILIKLDVCITISTPCTLTLWSIEPRVSFLHQAYIWSFIQCLVHLLLSLKLSTSLSYFSESDNRVDALDGGTGRLFACSGSSHGGHPQSHRTNGRKQCKNHNSCKTVPVGKSDRVCQGNGWEECGKECSV